MSATSPSKVLKDGTRRLYGRAKGKPLSTKQNRLVNELLPTICVPDAPRPPLQVIESYDQKWLEIGFGAAEHLLHQARLNPDVGILGIEPFLNGVAKALNGVEGDRLKNIALHHGDARPVLSRIADHSFEVIFVLFPDPWPKPRHNKRRILTDEFIEELHRLLKPGAELRFASDIDSYVDWTLIRVMRHGGFSFTPDSADDWRLPPKDWPGTRYEAKAHREGRMGHYFEFKRI